MKKTHLLYSLGVALLALPACTDKEIAPEDATQRPADGFLFRPETRADGIPIIDGNRQWIEKVSMTKGLDDSERQEFPNPNEPGDLSTYDDETHQFIARRDKKKEPFDSWLNQSTTFYYLGYPNIDRLTNPIKGDESFLANARGWGDGEQYSWNGIKYYDFKPARVHYHLTSDDYDWLPTYAIDDVNHVALSTNGIFSYAADILNVAGTHFTDFNGRWEVNGKLSFLSWYDQWNQTVGYQNREPKPNFSGWYVRSNMVYQYDMDLMKQITHNRVIFSGNKQYRPEAPSENVAGKDGYLYKTFDMKARMARLIIRVKSSYDQSKPWNATSDQYWLGDLLVMQIPQFFRMDDQNFFPLLDIKEYGDTGKDLMKRDRPKDGEGNHFSLDNAGGWTKKMGEPGKPGAFITLMNKDQSKNHAYEVSMKFHPIRNDDVIRQKLRELAERWGATVQQRKIAAEYNTPNYKTVCDVYIPPFDPRKAPIQGFVRYMEKDGTPIDYANKINHQTGQKFTSDEAQILRANADQCRFLSVNYFPHIRLNIRRPYQSSTGGENWVAITDIPIGKLNYDLIPHLKNAAAVTSDVSNEILKYFPSIVEPGHTYQLDISVGFGGDVEIRTYDSGKLIRHDRIVKYGEVAKPIRDQYDFGQSAPNLVY